jgi:hypothetical protein
VTSEFSDPPGFERTRLSSGAVSLLGPCGRQWTCTSIKFNGFSNSDSAFAAQRTSRACRTKVLTRACGKSNALMAILAHLARWTRFRFCLVPASSVCAQIDPLTIAPTVITHSSIVLGLRARFPVIVCHGLPYVRHPLHLAIAIVLLTPSYVAPCSRLLVGGLTKWGERE